MSNRYRLRWTVGSTFDYQKNMEFDKGRWVDIALVVESPKMTLYMCCEDGPEGSVTIQLLGRVMRMPYAKRRKTRELNRAYATIYGDAKGGLSPAKQVNSALA